MVFRVLSSLLRLPLSRARPVMRPKPFGRYVWACVCVPFTKENWEKTFAFMQNVVDVVVE